MIVTLLILVLFFIILWWAVGFLPPSARTPAQALFAVLAIIYVLEIFGVIPHVLPLPSFHF